MDLTRNEIKIYIATLSGLLKLINDMQNPSVKKIRNLIKEEFDRMLEKIGNQNKTIN